ncbi:MAG: glutamate 5-kinase [Actinomycetes bacterium]
MRESVDSARLVVVKVGSSSLTTASGGIDDERIGELARVLAERRARGVRVVLVSSGAIAAGLAPLGLVHRPRDLATQQAAASVGQGLLVHRYTAAMAELGITVGQVLLTADDVIRRTHYRNAARTLFRLLDLGVLPVVNENDTVATQEIRFGDNDRLAALVAQVLRADLLVLLSDVDGLYDGPPARPGSRLIREVRGPADLEKVVLGRVGAGGVGTGGIVTKIDAARLATQVGIPVVLAAAAQAASALSGGRVGTLFRSTGTRKATRLLWLAHATVPVGRLRLDPGAVAAVVTRRLSLLPAGVTGVEGRFAAGDPVDLVDESGVVVGRGLVSYDSSELPGLLGRSTRALAEELGAAYAREVVHRDDLVVLRRAAPASR